MPTGRSRIGSVLAFVVILLGFLSAFGSAGAQVVVKKPRPYVGGCGNPPCLAPPPTITISPTAASDTLVVHPDTITVCANGYPPAVDTAKFNGTSILGGFAQGANNCSYNKNSVSLVPGTNTIHVYACSPEESGNMGQCAVGQRSISHAALAVLPKGTAVNEGANVDTAVVFSVHNYTGGTVSYQLTPTCSGSGASNCSAPASVNVTYGTPASVRVAYLTGALNSTGTVKLKATANGYSDSGSFSTTSAWTNYVHLNAAFTNSGNQDVKRCQNSCFAAVTTLSTVPYISRDQSHNVTLVYNSDRAVPHPVLYADVTVDNIASIDTIQQLQLQASMYANGAWTAITFLNGEQILHFVGTHHITNPVRLAGQFDARSYATAVYPIAIQVSAIYSDHIETAVDTVQYPITNSGQSPIAKGWSILGVSRHYWQSNGQQNYIMNADGGGSAQVYGSILCYSWGCQWPSPPTVNTKMMYYNAAPNQSEVDFADSSKWIYNPGGYQIASISRTLDTVQIGYDAQNRVVAIYDNYRMYKGAHTYTMLKYGAYGLDSIVEPGADGTPGGGRITRVTVGSDSLLHAFVDPDGDSTSVVYDTQHRLTSMTDRSGATTTYTYDPTSFKVASVASASIAVDTGGGTVNKNPTTTFAPWNTVGVPTGTTNGNLATPVLVSSIQASVTDAGNHTTRFVVDSLGEALVTTDPVGNVTTVSRLNAAYDVVVQPATGGKAYYFFGYGPFQLSGFAPVGAAGTTDYTYDAFNQLTSVVPPNQPTITYYTNENKRGRVDSMLVTGDTLPTIYVYDSLYRITLTTDPEGHQTAYAYDSATGNLKTTTSLYSGRSQTTLFDQYGRDSAMRLTGSAQGRTIYDLMNRPVLVYDGVNPNPTTINYFPTEVEIIDAKGQRYWTDLNALGWPLVTTDAAGHGTLATYTITGQIASVINRRHQTIRFTYDPVGRPTSSSDPTYAGAPTNSFSYSTNGLIAVASNANAVDSSFTDSTGWTYKRVTVFPATGKYVRRLYQQDPTMPMRLDSVGYQTNMTGVDLYTKRYKYDPSTQLLDSIFVRGQALRFHYNGEVYHDSTIYPNGVVRVITRSPTHLPTQIWYSIADSSLNRTFAYDSADRLSQTSWTSGSTHYVQRLGYDGMNEVNWQQLATDTAGPTNCYRNPNNKDVTCTTSSGLDPYQGYAYAYDASGNMIWQYDSVLKGYTSATFVSSNRLTGWANLTYQSDSDGNRTQFAGGSNGTTTYTWNAGGQLLSVASGSTTTTFDYDATGQLVRRSVNGVAQEYFLWDGGQLTAELDGASNTRVAEYVYNPTASEPLALVTGTPGSTSIQWYAHDFTGNVLGTFGTATQQTLQYDPWGQVQLSTTNTGSLTNLQWKDFLFQGGNVNLYYAQARWYDPLTRRFLSEDLSGGRNQYTFGGGDPVNTVDPSGAMYCGAYEDDAMCGGDGDPTDNSDPGSGDAYSGGVGSDGDIYGMFGDTAHLSQVVVTGQRNPNTSLDSLMNAMLSREPFANGMPLPPGMGKVEADDGLGGTPGTQAPATGKFPKWFRCGIASTVGLAVAAENVAVFMTGWGAFVETGSLLEGGGALLAEAGETALGYNAVKNNTNRAVAGVILHQLGNMAKTAIPKATTGESISAMDFIEDLTPGVNLIKSGLDIKKQCFDKDE